MGWYLRTEPRADIAPPLDPQQDSQDGGTGPQDPDARPATSARFVAALVALLVAAAGMLVAIGAFWGVAPTPPESTVANGKIAYVVGEDGDIHLTYPGDSGTGRIIQRHAAGHEGGVATVWSPDGTRVAFTDWKSGDHRLLYAMNADGSGLVEFSTGLTDADSPAWSPDGTKIAFTGFDGDHGYEIYVVRADGAGRSRLTDEADNGVDGAHMLAWSPDGARIAFYANRYDQSSQTETQAIFTMGADGSDRVRVTDGSAIDESPIWSPDGAKIAFTRTTAGYSEVYVANANGTGVVNISNHPALDWATSWSTDGTGILLASQREGDWDIYLASLDGRLTRLTDHPSDDLSPAWSPDGTRIAFASNRAGSFDIFVMNTDGTGVTPVTGGPLDEYPSAWLPVPAAEQEPPQSPTPSPTELPPTIDSHPSATWQIGPRGNVGSVLAAFGGAWVAWLDDSAASQLTRIDAATNEIVATIPLRGGPVWVSDGGGMAAGAGSMWVTGGDRGSAVLHRIDPSSNRVIATIELGGGTTGADVAVDDNGVWAAASDLVVGGSSRLLHVDPETNQVVAEIPLNFEYVREVIAASGTILVRQLHWHGDADGPYTIWTAIDGRTNGIIAETEEDEIFGMWVWNDEVWAASWDGSRVEGMVRIDPATLSVIGEPAPIAGPSWVGSFEGGIGGIWFVGAAGTGESKPPITVYRFNPESGPLDVAVEVPKAGGVDMALGSGAIWFATFEGELRRFDLS